MQSFGRGYPGLRGPSKADAGPGTVSRVHDCSDGLIGMAMARWQIVVGGGAAVSGEAVAVRDLAKVNNGVSTGPLVLRL